MQWLLGDTKISVSMFRSIKCLSFPLRNVDRSGYPEGPHDIANRDSIGPFDGWHVKCVADDGTSLSITLRGASTLPQSYVLKCK